MTGDGWTEAVRRQLGLGRVLPLGGPGDGVWVTESAAGAVLRRAAQGVSGVRLGGLRLALADPSDAYVASVPAPPSALPPGPLRITAEFAAAATEPLPAAAARLREALFTAAADRLGLVVDEVDLGVTALLDEGEAPAADSPDQEQPPAESKPPSGSGDEAQVAAAALDVPGVRRLTGALGGLGHAVHIEESPAAKAALPRRHVRVELATAREHRALDVALVVRTAVGDALPDHPSVAVLITAVED
ncbi:nucleopolyhedrovirus P10 family protein [Streptomyces sp. NBC_01381]|uniref:nucleopolyhedrovirus P10 family protein n=1 Tax=Streptomyces sp. NBC_01381 TaxID=2903845 RepID=UPI00225B4E62|nr:nucleopolyhedrovirus P10 family protein [Streptomyces sp. NBC_01381]MCX4668187.1 nucleopolyhedrovirus P10 family protein [Streptomyces sp. NBC_01381]